MNERVQSCNSGLNGRLDMKSACVEYPLKSDLKQKHLKLAWWFFFPEKV